MWLGDAEATRMRRAGIRWAGYLLFYSHRGMQPGMYLCVRVCLPQLLGDAVGCTASPFVNYLPASICVVHRQRRYSPPAHTSAATFLHMYSHVLYEIPESRSHAVNVPA